MPLAGCELRNEESVRLSGGRRVAWRQDPVQQPVLVEVAFKASLVLAVAIKEHGQILRVLNGARTRRDIKPHASSETLMERPRLYRLVI